MDFYSCFDGQGEIIGARLTKINVLKKMGRQLGTSNEKRGAVVCSLTGSPSDFNMDY